MAKNHKLARVQQNHQRLSIAVQCHAAFLTMTARAQSILIDLYANHARWTRYYSVDLPEPGVPYSFGHCSLLVHRNTFRTSMRAILDRGFFIEHDHDRRFPEVRYYLPVNHWRHYQPTPKEIAQLTKLRHRMAAADARDERNFRRQPGRTAAQFLCMPQHIFWAHSPSHQHNFCAPNPGNSTKIVQPLPYGRNEKIQEPAHARGKQEQNRPLKGDPQAIGDLLPAAVAALLNQPTIDEDPEP